MRRAIVGLVLALVIGVTAAPANADPVWHDVDIPGGGGGGAPPSGSSRVS